MLTTEDTSTTTDPTPHAVLAVCSLGAAVIHFAMVPPHAQDVLWHGLAFALAGWFQLVWAALAWFRPSRRLLTVGIAGNLAFLAAWAVSHTWGLPGGAHAGEPEAIGSIDLLASGLEALVVVGAVAVLLRPARDRSRGSAWLTTVVPALAVLGLTTAAVASPAAQHGHDDDHGSAAHDHASAAIPQAVVDEVSTTRCDEQLNPAAYYTETVLAGVDTMFGGGGHEHAATETASDHSTMTDEQHLEWLRQQSEPQPEPAPTAERGEADDARLVIDLAAMTDAEYRTFIGNLNVANRDPNAPDDNGGHGGHVGPHPWTAMIDQDRCDQLVGELEVARDVALAHPTPADAVAAGYVAVTSYVPGIAAHYMNFAYVDDDFEVDRPEMILYDGNGEDANVVGLSYYLVHDGDDEPTDGFTGPNDHYHRHIGLCVAGTMVIGDSTTTDEECAARGGRKQGGSGGWMSHAWVVPGCESPWGIFSGANPILEGGLGAESGQGAPCSGSSVLDRYDLRPGPIDPGDGEQAAGG